MRREGQQQLASSSSEDGEGAESSWEYRRTSRRGTRPSVRAQPKSESIRAAAPSRHA